MQYKLLCTDKKWLPKEDGGIWLWKEILDGPSKIPCGDPKALNLQNMHRYDKVCKDLGRFFNL